MSKQALHVPAGKLFCLSSGEYSDYHYNGHFLALVEITPEMFASVVDEAKAEARKQYGDRGYDDDYGADYKFIPALIRRGWIMDVDCLEIHTGSYGELDLS